MLCACSGEQFKFEEPPQSPVSLATRDFSASGISSRNTGDWESKLEESQVDEAESTLKEALSLNYEEARALLGRLEFQRGNFDAALQVFQGIDIRSLTSKMIDAIVERTRPRKPHSKGNVVPLSVMSMHSVSLLLEAILLKAKSLEELSHFGEAAKQCRVILEVVESALPDGMPEGIGEDCKLEEMFHKALELLPILWTKAGLLDEAMNAYRRALVKPWNLDPIKLAGLQKDLAWMLLYGAVEARVPSQLHVCGPTDPKSNIEEAILLLLVLMSKVACGEIKWDEEIMDHLSYALSVTGEFELLAKHVEQALPGVYSRSERWYLLSLCYSAAGQNESALNLLKKAAGFSESKREPHIPAFMFGAKLCSQDPNYAHDGIDFSRKVIELAGDEHFKGEAHKFLGICYGNAARSSLSNSERILLQRESLDSLNCSASMSNVSPDTIYGVALENALQRNLDVAFDSAMTCTETVGGNPVKGWKLLALIVSAKKQFKDAKTIVEFAMDEAGRTDQLELLRLKAVLQIAQEQPKQAIETYRILLSLIQTQRELHAKNSDKSQFCKSEKLTEKELELVVWQDLALLYMELGILVDAKVCMERAKLMEFHSPRSWYTTGVFFKTQSLYKEAFISFLVSLSIDPDYVPSIVSTGETLMKLGSQTLPIARSFLMNALRLDPSNHQAWLNLGYISKKEGLLQQAADYFQAAYELELSAPVLPFGREQSCQL